MSEKSPTLHIAAQYTKEASFIALTRPYENREQVAIDFQTQSRHEKLPQEGAWRVEQDVTLTGTGGGAPLFTAVVSQEFIVVVEGLTEAEQKHVLQVQVPSRMFAYARSQLATLSMGTGYGPLTLPPVPDTYIQNSNKLESES